MTRKSEVLNELERALLEFVKNYLADSRGSSLPLTPQRYLLSFCYYNKFNHTAIIILHGLIRDTEFKFLYNTWYSMLGKRFYHKQLFECHQIRSQLYSKNNKLNWYN